MKRYAPLVLLVLFLPSAKCLGNLSGPWHPGQLLLDVEGVKDIAIVREKLQIDLRPLEQRDLIKITATYVIDHRLPPKDLPLTFITGVDSVKGVHCRHNGKPLSFTTRQVVNMPANWKPPGETPGFVPDEQLLNSRNITDTQHEWILFTVPLQTGQQVIEVSYEVEAGAYYSLYYTARYWQTAYILAPARTWKSFGKLEVEVLAPDNWQVKSNLPLVQQGHLWTASFDGLPADFITLTTHHPMGRRAWVLSMTHSLYLFGIMTLLLGLRHMTTRCRQVKQLTSLDTQPPCHQHTSWLLFLCSFLPIAFNVVFIYVDFSNIPSTHSNYQLPVIFVYFQSMYWLIFLAPLMLMSRAVLWCFCKLGTWLGRRYLDKQMGQMPALQSNTSL